MIDALNRKDAERRNLHAELAAHERPTEPADQLKPRTLRRTLRGYLNDWHATVNGNVPEARGLIETVLRSRIVFRPVTEKGVASYEITRSCRYSSTSRVCN